jgi:hypothetical protein
MINDDRLMPICVSQENGLIAVTAYLLQMRTVSINLSILRDSWAWYMIIDLAPSLRSKELLTVSRIIGFLIYKDIKLQSHRIIMMTCFIITVNTFTRYQKMNISKT